MTTNQAQQRYQLYVYFKCQAHDQAQLLRLQAELAQVLQSAGLSPQRLQRRPLLADTTDSAQTWMEVYDEVDAAFISWLEQLPVVQQVRDLSLQGRHTECFETICLSAI